MDVAKIIVSLVGTTAVLAIVAFLIEGSHHLAKLRGDTSRIKRAIFLGIVCGLFGIYATIAGTTLENGAVVSVRDAGPLMAGLLGGPLAGLIAGFIAGLYRLLSGLPDLTAGSTIPCAISTLLIGVICGFSERSYKKAKFRSLFALLAGFIMEDMHILIAFFYYWGVRGIDSAWQLVQDVALPMILANSIGAFIISFTMQMVYHYRKSEDHDRQTSAELNVANSIQNDMLPVIFPDFPGRKEFSLSAKMTPAKQVGGDFYDFFFVDDDHFAFLIGDVSDKGVPAALFMVISKTILKNDTQLGLSPAEVLTKANKELCEGNKEGMFVTVWLGIYEISTGKLTYANAGHNPPLIKQSKNGFEYLKNISGLVLAGSEKMKYKEYSTILKDGDKILLYTDGITEAMNEEGKQFGENRLKELLDKTKVKANPDEIVANIQNAVINYRGKAEQSDDITMLLLVANAKYKQLTLEAKIENFDKFSSFLNDILNKNNIPDGVVNKMDVVLDELYSNIVNYSKSENCTLCVALHDNSVDILVKYQGVLFDITKAKEPDITLKAEERDIGGLGLFIVKKSVDFIDYHVENENTNVINLIKKY